MGEKSCYSFPLESIPCQAWTSSSGAQMDRGWERLGDGFSMLCRPIAWGEVTPLHGVLSHLPLDVFHDLRSEIGIDVV